MSINKLLVPPSACLLLSVLSPTASADFLADSSAKLNMRNFYYNNDNRSSGATQSKIEEWAQGFVVDFRSGYTEGDVGVGLDALGMLGMTLDSGKGRHLNNTMIPSDSDDRAVSEWTRLGLTAKVKFSKNELKYGTLIPKLPVLVATDGRLLPQTFDGVQLNSTEFNNLSLTAGRLESTTGRGSTDRTGLSIAGASKESDHFDFGGADWKITDNLLGQYYFARMENFYDQHFVGLVHILPIASDQTLKTDLRYWNSQGIGENDKGTSGYRASGYTKNNSGRIDNQTWSATLIYSYGAHAWTLGHQQVSDDSGFFQPNQGGLADKGAGGASAYTYTDRLVYAFTRAGERTNYAGYAYDFAALGIPGLKASFMYLKGDQIKTLSSSDAEEWEANYFLDYVVQSGPLKGLSLSWKDGKGRSSTFGDVDQTRVSLNYSIALF